MEVLVLSVSFIILYTVSSLLSTQFAGSCSRDYIQICENCKAASHCSGAKEETGITDINECKEMCRLNTTCILAEYITNASKCVMYSCSETEIDANYAVIRKACTSDCGRFTVKKKLKRVGSCEFLLSGCALTETACASLCYDLSGCRSFSHNTSRVACNLHRCTNSVGRTVEEWNQTVRECLATVQITTPPSSSIDSPTCQQTIPNTLMTLMDPTSETPTVFTTYATQFRLTSSAVKERSTGKHLIFRTAALHSTAINSKFLRHSLNPTVRSSTKPSTTVPNKYINGLIKGTSTETLSAAHQTSTDTTSYAPQPLNSSSKKPIPYNRKHKSKCLSCTVRPSILLVVLLFSAYSGSRTL